MKNYNRRNSGGAGVIALVAVAAFILLALIGFGMYISLSNSEIRLRNAIKAKQVDNKNEMDNMVKKISQSGQVSQQQAEQIKDVVVGYANARNTGKGAGSFASVLTESVPNLPPDFFKANTNLQNIIVSSRDAFTQRQKEILDMNREHDNILDTFPGSFFLGGRPHIEVIVVTSTRTENAFSSGKDDDDSVFHTPTPATAPK